jgi:hypothetical protein
MLKRTLGILLFCVLLFGAVAPVTVNAAIVSSDLDDDLTLYMAYTRSTTQSLSISGGQAVATASITGYPSTTTKVKITLYLEKRGLLGLYWTTTESWSQTFNNYSGTLCKTYSVSSGTYRVRAVYVAYSGSSSETITGYSSETST